MYPTQWDQHQIMADRTAEASRQPLSPHALILENQDTIPTAQIKPSASVKLAPQNEADHANIFRTSPGGVSQLEDFTSKSWAMPQHVETLQPEESQMNGTPIETGHDSALLSWMIPPPAPHPLQTQETKRHVSQKQGQKKQKRQNSRKKRVPVWLVAVSILTILAIVLTQGNGVAGAWAADEFRAIAGPVAAAQVEAWYLSAQNTANKLEYQLGFQHISAPHTKLKVVKLARPAKALLKPMALTAMQPMLLPALDGEGTWNTLEAAPGTYNYLPLDAKAFIRPDPNTSYAVVSLLQFDARFMRLHIVAGTQEPGGPLAMYGTGIIPQADQAGNALLATLNGGFKYADGAFGLMSDGKVYVPPQPNAATIAITKSGKLIIGSWGVNPQLTSNNKNLVAWRQNAGLLIDKGEISTLAKDGAAWGGTILNSEYTWRSGLGLTAEGNLIYAAGNALLPETLGKALKAAGAVMAMEIDINPFWTRAFLYQQDKNGALTINKLSTDMQGTGREYLTPNLRDFFYLTRYTPTPPK
ncbi:hypothetical protein [Dictyobacter arantiisoli]|uniref:Phosphodiester glycosidase domain-containing protein n=1 Tax=Dictyobacter arantiisoli TaxID=2014874 RepID=A0A5A5TAV5_9CHLR|nr:hypothetical protein [Dictyobacter arantiisoli]GCF08487.1 hypothetical protein KDI_20510 [Dictyobacter arantiisoli]